MQVVKKRKIWFGLSIILVSLSIASLSIYGLRLGIDFSGGSLMEVSFTQDRPAIEDVVRSLEPFALGGVNAQPVGDKDVILRFRDVDEPTHQAILNNLKETFKPKVEITNDSKNENVPQLVPSFTILEEKRFDSVGPIIGEELKKKTGWALITVLFAIVAYVAWAFRKLSKRISSWKYGVVTLIALFHDVIIVVGIFALLGKLYGIEINAPFVAALLTILGYSVNDTIVVFDRLRENLRKQIDAPLSEIVQTSINQTVTRSINTSLTTLLVLGSIFLFGGESVRSFVLALIVGVAFGTYSSIFIASPLLVAIQKKN
tara:strand:+ start:914 stop:1861 length:948 start_codon:yes stop_codon:yes gene_type:complete